MKAQLIAASLLLATLGAPIAMADPPNCGKPQCQRSCRVEKRRRSLDASLTDPDMQLSRIRLLCWVS